MAYIYHYTSTATITPSDEHCGTHTANFPVRTRAQGTRSATAPRHISVSGRLLETSIQLSISDPPPSEDVWQGSSGTLLPWHLPSCKCHYRARREGQCDWESWLLGASSVLSKTLGRNVISVTVCAFLCLFLVINVLSGVVMMLFCMPSCVSLF